uniref:Glutathione synthetase n=1 Tax=Acrobeloides nanus TaxID=290746 RepID=A0A914C710_9BILA
MAPNEISMTLNGSTKSLSYIENSVKSEDLDLLVEDALDYAHSIGFVLRTNEHKDRSDICQALPFSLLPSPFPGKLFNQAMSVQTAMNLLYFRASWDYDFLMKSHEAVIKTDVFIRKLSEIMTKVRQEGVRQTKTLVLQRADYMCHAPDGRIKGLKQIEVNNIASGMAGMSMRLTKLHNRLLTKMGFKQEVIKERLPDNQALLSQGPAIVQAWKDFGDPQAVVLFVVEEVNQNQFDQRLVEYSVEELSNGEIKVIRATLTALSKRLHISESHDLFLDNSLKVAIVYFRAGYSPCHYPTEAEWEVRLMMERSTAVKCPWIGLQLANTKKVQQMLAAPGVIEHFFRDLPEVVSEIRKTFANLWGLENDDDETENVIKDAIANPESYVLKPQLEGGGGNVFGQNISTLLSSMSKEERSAYILMEKIAVPLQKNYLIRAFHPVRLENIVNELGIFGALYGNGQTKEIFSNVATGYLMRSKYADMNEGGIACGAAVMDTPFLY